MPEPLRQAQLIMRILHVLDHSIPLHSGYAFRTLAILREQRALGWETLHVTSAKHTGATAAVEEIDGLRFYRTLASGGIAGRLPVLDQLEIIRSLAKRLMELIPELKPDLLHAHSPSLNGVAALWAGRRYSIPVIYEVRALWEDGAVDHGVATAGSVRYRATRALETWVLQRAAAVTTICDGLRREIVGRGIPERKVTVIPNAVDAARFTAGREARRELAERLGIKGKRVIGFIGSFYAYEGLSLLLKALPKMLERMPAVRVLLVGGGYEEERLTRQAADAGLSEKVVFAGLVPHDRIQDYYDLVDVFVYPRERTRVTEFVTPLKPLEAMAQGRVVVASDVGGHRELIEAGKTGWLFRAGDADSLAETVLHVLQHPEDAAQMCARARRFVEDERSWSASVARYAGVYARLLAGGQFEVAH
jgi:PEP-CTERM/exosortase A-associated glycosyltransferase